MNIQQRLDTARAVLCVAHNNYSDALPDKHDDVQISLGENDQYAKEAARQAHHDDAAEAVFELLGNLSLNQAEVTDIHGKALAQDVTSALTIAFMLSPELKQRLLFAQFDLDNYLADAQEQAEEAVTVRQTSCNKCGADVEGFSDSPMLWRDRGGSTFCADGVDMHLATHN